MAKEKEVKEEVVTEKVTDKHNTFVENRLAAINKIQDKGRRRRASAAIFRRGN